MVSPLVVLLYIFIVTMAASPAIHHFIHPDADQGSHHCAATLLSQGQVDAASIGTVVVRPDLLLGNFILPAAPELATADYRLMPGRAPPSHRA